MLGKGGVSSFSELQLALSEGKGERMIFYAFDLLWLDGEDLRREPLIDRKERLRDVMRGLDEQGRLRFSEHFSEPGKVMLEHACRMGLEGVVSKRADAPYRSGRGHDWVKSKCTLRQEFVIAGYLPSDKAGRGIRSLVLGYHKDGKLQPVGPCRHRLFRPRHDRSSEEARCAEDQSLALFRRRRQGKRRSLGEAGARRGNRVPFLDERRQYTPGFLPGLAGGQAGQGDRGGKA